MPAPGSSSSNPDENTPNPFADNLPDQPYSDDPFASPGEGEPDPKSGLHYESMAPDRGSSLLTMAVIGVIISILGAIPLFCCYPMNVFALALTLPAWLLAKSDLRGMDLGAIDSTNRRQTRTAKWLGIAGTWIAVLPFVVVIVMIIIGVGTDSMMEFREMLGF